MLKYLSKQKVYMSSTNQAIRFYLAKGINFKLI
jgi:hypothetical protein